jgi:hypothetical protein
VDSFDTTSPERADIAIFILLTQSKYKVQRVATLRGKKGIPVTSRGGPCGCETSRLPHLLDKRLADGGEVASPTRQAILVTGRGCLYGCETSRLPHFLDNLLTDGGEVASLMRRAPFAPGRFLVAISVRG